MVRDWYSKEAPTERPYRGRGAARAAGVRAGVLDEINFTAWIRGFLFVDPPLLAIQKKGATTSTPPTTSFWAALEILDMENQTLG